MASSPAAGQENGVGEPDGSLASMDVLELDCVGELRRGSAIRCASAGLLHDSAVAGVVPFSRSPVLVVVGTDNGSVCCAAFDAESQRWAVRSEVKAGDGPIQDVQIGEVGDVRSVVLLRTDEGAVKLLELPTLRHIAAIDGVLDDLLAGSQATALQPVLDDGGRRRALRIAAVLGQTLRIVDVDEFAQTAHLLDETSLGFRAERVQFGGRDGRTICASLRGRHALVRTNVSPRGTSIAVAAVVEGSAGNNPASPTLRTEQLDPGANPFLSALTLGLIGAGGGKGGEGQAPKEAAILSVPVAEERWLLSTGDGGHRIYTSFGAAVESTVDGGAAEVLWAVSSQDGAVLLTERAGDPSDRLEIYACAGPELVPLDPLDLDAEGLPTRPGSGRRPVLLSGAVQHGTALAAVAVWSNPSTVAVIRLRRPLSETVDLLVADGKLEQALALALEKDGAERRRQLKVELGTRYLLAGDHEVALKLLARAGLTMHEMINLRDRMVPEEWSTPENITHWARELAAARRSGAAAAEPTAEDDEALLRALALADQTSDRITALFRTRHAVRSAIGEEVLSSPEQAPHLLPEHRERALIELLRSVGEHDRALGLVERSRSADGGSAEALNYLRDVDSEEVLEKHLRICLDGPADRGLLDSAVEVLLEAPITADAKLRVARAQTPEFAVHYATALLAEEPADRAPAQNVLIEAIARQIDERRAPEPAGGAHPLEESDGSSEAAALAAEGARQKLVVRMGEILNVGVADTAFVVELLPSELWERRVEMLGNLGRHEEAMRILAREGGDSDVIERYCRSMDLQRRGPAMTSLMKAYLERGSESAEFVKRAAALAGSSASQEIDLVAALRGASDSTEIGFLHEFLLTAVSAATARSHAAHIQRALLKSETLRSRDALLRERSASIDVTSDMICHECRRRIGESVFAHYKDGTNVHYACLRGGRDGELAN